MTDWSLSETRPGSHITELCGTTGAQAVTDQLHDSSEEENMIRSIAGDKLGLRYSTVSELNSAGSALCGLFWDPRDTFIIVAFKGTTPTDFSEWSADFTFQLRDAGLWLRGFGKGLSKGVSYLMSANNSFFSVHDGFMNKVFPRRIPPGSRMPYCKVSSTFF